MNDKRDVCGCVCVTTEILDRLSLTRLDLIKLDVEGHELAVLEGAITLVSRFQPWIVFEYSHGEGRDGAPLLAFLAQQGYAYVDLATLAPLESGIPMGITDGVAFPAHETAAMSFLKALGQVVRD